MEGIPDPSLYPSRGLWPGKGPNQVCFNSFHTRPLFLVDLFHFDLISPLKCIKERSHQSTGLQHIPWRTNSLKLRSVIYLKLWLFPLSTLHYIKKSWMWHLHFKVIFILYSRERKNWHKRSISTSLIPDVGERACVHVCVCVCVRKNWNEFTETKWKACQIFLHLQTLFSLFVSVFTAMRQYLRARSSQSSAYDNRTAQTCGSSQCCLPLLHTSPNLRLSLSFSHSSSLPPSPFAFVLRDRALLTWRVTIVAESIL